MGSGRHPPVIDLRALLQAGQQATDVQASAVKTETGSVFHTRDRAHGDEPCGWRPSAAWAQGCWQFWGQGQSATLGSL